MNRTTSTWLVLGSILVAAACSGESGDPVKAPGTAAQPETPEDEVHERTKARLVERSRARAELMCSAEWIDVYDFVHPETKQWMSIYQFLEGKDNHEYGVPTEPQIIAKDGDTAYVSLTALWTPRHELLGTLDNVPENWDPTERIEWIETWNFVEGDWHMQWPQQYPGDFFEEHPELLKTTDPAADEEVARADER